MSCPGVPQAQHAGTAHGGLTACVNPLAAEPARSLLLRIDARPAQQSRQAFGAPTLQRQQLLRVLGAPVLLIGTHALFPTRRNQRAVLVHPAQPPAPYRLENPVPQPQTQRVAMPKAVTGVDTIRPL